MDAKFARDLKPGARVAVYMGAIVADVYGTPPIVTTGTVLADAHGEKDQSVWVNVDYAEGETLPQRYRVEEIIGFMLPMAVVTHHPDGSATGTFLSSQGE